MHTTKMQPSIILGTHRVPKEALAEALNTNCIRVLDTATAYNNADTICDALKETKTQVDIITKFNPTDFENDINEITRTHYAMLTQHATCNTILLHSSLKTDAANVNAILKLKSLFPTCRIGVSNFDIEKLTALVLNMCKPDVISIEYHPYYQPLKLIEFCKQFNIQITGYRTFAKGLIFADETINKIAEKHNATVTDVVISWCLINGISPTVSATKSEHISSISKFTKVELDAADMQRILLLNKAKEGSTCMLKYCKHD